MDVVSTTASPASFAELLAAIAREATRRRGRFDVVLAGGRSPAGVYRMLATHRMPWHLWRIVASDERCLPVGHPDRNDTMLRTQLLDPADAPRRVLRELPAELGPKHGARAASSLLRDTGQFDLVVLGLGEDGHTASLFGETAQRSALPCTPDVIGVDDAPKVPRERLSLSAQRLARTRRLVVLVAGDGKRTALRQLLDGDDVPAAHVAAPRRLIVELTEDG